jgi:hypothetical protein
MPWIIPILVLAIPLLAIVLDSPLGQALAARLKESAPDTLPGESDRVLYLEGEVERLATEVQRLAVEGQFLHKLLTEREPREALPSGESGSPD